MSTAQFHRFVQTAMPGRFHEAAMLARRPLEQAKMAEWWRARMQIFALQRQLAEHGLPSLERILNSSNAARAAFVLGSKEPG